MEEYPSLTLTNKTIDLGIPTTKKSKKVPKHIRQYKRRLRSQYSSMIHSRGTVNEEKEKVNYIQMRTTHRKLVREAHDADNVRRDSELYSLVSGDPRSVFRKIKTKRSSSAGNIQLLKVANFV